MMNVTHAFPRSPRHLGLYPVVDSVEWIARLLDAGVTTMQLRVKDLPDERPKRIIEAIALGASLSTRGCSLTTTGVWRLKHRCLWRTSGSGRPGHRRP
jgi:thiamine-phosphate pyrophosphorylase